MKYRLLGRSGLRVSEACLGTMTFGEDWGWGAPADTCRRMYAAFRDAGGNFVDTADMYVNGESEKITGELIGDHREEVVLATKYSDAMDPGHPNGAGNARKHMVQAVEASLKRLGTDYIDLYWVHSWDFATPADEVMRGLDDLVSAGKVLYVGASDTPAWKVAQANTMAELRGWSRFVGIQIEYSLIERTPERELLPMADDLGLGILAWSPLASGLLTGKYNEQGKKEGGERRLDQAGTHEVNDRNLGIAAAVVDVANAIGAEPAQVALAWVARKGIIPLLGATKLSQLESNLGALEIELEGAHLKQLEEASAISLGFPHEFLEQTREITWGGAFANTYKDGVRGLLPRQLAGDGKEMSW